MPLPSAMVNPFRDSLRLFDQEAEQDDRPHSKETVDKYCEPR